MFDLDGMLLGPDRSPVSLRGIAGNRGLVVVGVGRGGERGFQMVHRFHEVGDRMAIAGSHLAFVYPRESARHVMDPISVASARFRRHPHLLLDADACCFAPGIPPRSLTAVCLGVDLERLAGTAIDLHSATWESELRAFLAVCQRDLLSSTRCTAFHGL